MIRSPTDRQVPGNSFKDRVAVWQAIAAEELAATIAAGVEALATDPVVADRIASEAGISHEAAVETGTPLEGAPGDTTDPEPAVAAIAAPTAWEAEEASVVAAAGGAGSTQFCGTAVGRNTAA